MKLMIVFAGEGYPLTMARFNPGTIRFFRRPHILTTRFPTFDLQLVVYLFTQPVVENPVHRRGLFESDPFQNVLNGFFLQFLAHRPIVGKPKQNRIVDSGHLVFAYFHKAAQYLDGS